MGRSRRSFFILSSPLTSPSLRWKPPAIQGAFGGLLIQAHAFLSPCFLSLLQQFWQMQLQIAWK